MTIAQFGFHPIDVHSSNMLRQVPEHFDFIEWLRLIKEWIYNDMQIDMRVVGKFSLTFQFIYSYKNHDVLKSP